MLQTKDNVWLHWLACALALATLFLVALGGVVTTKGVGMAVPDWPTTYGHHMFFFPFSYWYAGVFDEHFHRVWASFVGIIAALFAIWVWARDSSGRERWWGIIAMIAGLGLVGVRKPTMFVVVACVCVGVIGWAIPRAIRSSNRLRWLGVIMFAAVIIQGVLGGLRVLLDERGWGTEFGIFHAVFAQLFFLLVCSLVLITSKWWLGVFGGGLNPASGVQVRRAFWFTSALILLQLFLGATMRHQHQGLAVSDFPMAYGKFWPSTDAASVAAYNANRLEAAGENPITRFHIVVHMLHRFTAGAVLLAILGCARLAWRNSPAGSVLRKVAFCWVTLGLIQVALGILTILSLRKVDVTTAHVAVGALTFAVGWMLVLMASRLASAKITAPSAARLASGVCIPAAAGELKHA